MRGFRKNVTRTSQKVAATWRRLSCRREAPPVGRTRACHAASATRIAPRPAKITIQARTTGPSAPAPAKRAWSSPASAMSPPIEKMRATL